MSAFTDKLNEFITAAQAAAPDAKTKLFDAVICACECEKAPAVAAGPGDDAVAEKCKEDLDDLVATCEPAHPKHGKVKATKAGVGAASDWAAWLTLLAPFFQMILDRFLKPKTP